MLNLTRISKKDAAKMLNLNEQSLTQLLINGELKEVGFAYKNKSGNYSYLIYRENVENYINKITGEIK